MVVVVVVVVVVVGAAEVLAAELIKRVGLFYQHLMAFCSWLMGTLQLPCPLHPHIISSSSST